MQKMLKQLGGMAGLGGGGKKMKRPNLDMMKSMMNRG